MVEKKLGRLNREDWLKAAAEQLRVAGIDSIKIAPLAAQIGVTTGSFYWHFKNRMELLIALLGYWEQTMTTNPITVARKFKGSPKDRILIMMEQVLNNRLAEYDLAIWHWSQTDVTAQKVFKRVLEKRFSFARWMFMEAGFTREQSQVRGRMMVVYLMGESTLIPDSMSKRKETLKINHAILTHEF